MVGRDRMGQSFCGLLGSVFLESRFGADSLSSQTPGLRRRTERFVLAASRALVAVLACYSPIASSHPPSLALETVQRDCWVVWDLVDSHQMAVERVLLPVAHCQATISFYQSLQVAVLALYYHTRAGPHHLIHLHPHVLRLWCHQQLVFFAYIVLLSRPPSSFRRPSERVSGKSHRQADGRRIGAVQHHSVSAVYCRPCARPDHTTREFVLSQKCRIDHCSDHTCTSVETLYALPNNKGRSTQRPSVSRSPTWHSLWTLSLLRPMR